MNLNAPSQVAFIISVVLLLFALLERYQITTLLTGQAFWIVTAAYIVLAGATLIRRA